MFPEFNRRHFMPSTGFHPLRHLSAQQIQHLQEQE